MSDQPGRSEGSQTPENEPVSPPPISSSKNTEEIVVEQLSSNGSTKTGQVPLSAKFISVVLVSAIGFGGHWSSGITGAMKSKLKKGLHINNTQFALLEASEDFMVTALILVSGVVTDRLGGASTMLWGNAIYSIGSILVAGSATARSYKFMIGGRVILAFGDIATQVAQYKVFSSWFPPSHGFAATLGLELGLGKIGSFVGQSTANIIANKTGDFAWVFWCAVFMNLFTNVATFVFWLYTRYCRKQYTGMNDPATGEKLTESNKKFEIKKMLQLSWVTWSVILFSLFQTSTAIVFSQNATELAEERFHVSSVVAGWYSAMPRYLGFFLVPCLGVFIDLLGNRLTVLAVCGTGTFLAMALVCWASSISGTAAAFGIYAFAVSLGPTSIIDGIRTSLWHQEVFGSAYAAKIAVNNAMNIIVRIVTGVIQDADDNSYDRVVIVYVVLSIMSMFVAMLLCLLALKSEDLRILQWTKKQRLQRGEIINERKNNFVHGKRGSFNRQLSMTCFGGLIVLILGSWSAYFWGVATGNND